MITDKQVRTRLKEILQTASGSNTRVYGRWRLSLDPKDWKGTLKSPNDPEKVDGWILTRKSMRHSADAPQRWRYTWVYVLWYFRTVREGSDISNSEDEVHALLDAVRDAFEATPQLDLSEEDSWVDEHGQFQVLDVDTVEDQYHLAQCELAVRLTKEIGG